MTIRCLGLLVVFTVLFSGCRSVLHKSDSVTGEILARSAQWNSGFHDKDMVQVMELFSPDAQFASAGGKWQSKEGGLTAFAMLLMKRRDLQWRLHPKDIKVNTNWGVANETGDWSEWWTEPDGKARIEGTYSLMWKKRPGEPWLIHAAIFTPLSCTGESGYCGAR